MKMILSDSKISMDACNNIPVPLERRSLKNFCFFSLLFIYFLFSSCEQLYVLVGIFKPKIGHLVALFLFGWMLLERKAWSLPRPILNAFILILGSMLLSAMFGTAPGRSLGYVAVFLFNFIFYFFLPLQILKMIELDRFFSTYWKSFVVMALYATGQVLLSLFGIYDSFALQRVGFIARGQAFLYEPSYYALYMIPYVMFLNGERLLQNKGRGAFPQRLKLFCQNMLLVISTSTGLLVSYATFFAIYALGTLSQRLGFVRLLILRKMQKALFIFLLSMGVMTFLFYEMALYSIFKFFYFGWSHISFAARWEGIVQSFKIFLAHPLLGVGIGGVGPALLEKESVYDSKIETLPEFEAFDPTNCFTEILASLGMIGFLAFGYLGMIFFKAYNRVMKNKTISFSAKKMATTLFFSLIIMGVALQMNQGLFRPYVWIHAAVVYGYLQRAGLRSSTLLVSY